MIKAIAYAATSATSPLDYFQFERRHVGEHDVRIEILYCGVCHSDIHQARNEWGGSIYPMVPGHEIVGKVAEVGSKVTKFKIGDSVGVGCMVDSCKTCHACENHLEQFCEKGSVGTYNSYEKDKITPTYGGYSNVIVVNEEFVLKISPTLDLARVAPLLCAGITTYSPLKHWKVKKGQKVGVIGLGGLGHMAVKIANAMGAYVVVFTTSPNKKEDAIKLGAHTVIVSKNKDEMAAQKASFDFILDTVSADHDISTYLNLLKVDGSMVMVGLPEKHQELNIGSLIFGRKNLAGSLIGGIKETQEMLDFCAEHNLLADVEIIPIQKINEAYERVLKSDVKYRFVIDMSSLANK